MDYIIKSARGPASRGMTYYMVKIHVMMKIKQIKESLGLHGIRAAY